MLYPVELRDDVGRRGRIRTFVSWVRARGTGPAILPAYSSSSSSTGPHVKLHPTIRAQTQSHKWAGAAINSKTRTRMVTSSVGRRRRDRTADAQVFSLPLYLLSYPSLVQAKLTRTALVLRKGFEPSTSSLPRRCSTTELPQRCLADGVGFEPTHLLPKAHCFQDSCRYPESFGLAIHVGPSREIRTPTPITGTGF